MKNDLSVMHLIESDCRRPMAATVAKKRSKWLILFVVNWILTLFTLAHPVSASAQGQQYLFEFVSVQTFGARNYSNDNKTYMEGVQFSLGTSSNWRPLRSEMLTMRDSPNWAGRGFMMGYISTTKVFKVRVQETVVSPGVITGYSTTSAKYVIPVTAECDGTTKTISNIKRIHLRSRQHERRILYSCLPVATPIQIALSPDDQLFWEREPDDLLIAPASCRIDPDQCLHRRLVLRNALKKHVSNAANCNSTQEKEVCNILKNEVAWADKTYGVNNESLGDVRFAYLFAENRNYTVPTDAQLAAHKPYTRNSWKSTTPVRITIRSPNAGGVNSTYTVNMRPNTKVSNNPKDPEYTGNNYPFFISEQDLWSSIAVSNFPNHVGIYHINTTKVLTDFAVHEDVTLGHTLVDGASAIPLPYSNKFRAVCNGEPQRHISRDKNDVTSMRHFSLAYLCWPEENKLSKSPNLQAALSSCVGPPSIYNRLGSCDLTIGANRTVVTEACLSATDKVNKICSKVLLPALAEWKKENPSSPVGGGGCPLCGPEESDQ
jgi:hypothetical protein